MEKVIEESRRNPRSAIRDGSFEDNHCDDGTRINSINIQQKVETASLAFYYSLLHSSHLLP